MVGPEDQGRTPGELLRAAREARGQSRSELAGSTRIAEHFLAALEADEFDTLPPLYVRSFLRSYATALGLSPEDILARHDHAGVPGAAAPAGAAVWEEEVQVRRIGPGRAGRILRWLGLAVGAAVMVALAVRLLDCSSREAFGPQTGSAGGQGGASAVALGDVGGGSGGTVVALGGAPGGAGGSVLPPAPAGEPPLLFGGGETHPLVLRLLVGRPVAAAVATDGDGAPRPVVWPGVAGGPTPSGEIEPGVAYATREGLAVYWGARERLLLRLEALSGVEVRLNGRVLAPPLDAAGRDWVLDASLLARP